MTFSVYFNTMASLLLHLTDSFNWKEVNDSSSHCSTVPAQSKGDLTLNPVLLFQVHQHQDRGETFQCELCPFTSSRHFSLKLHMRCHQHFPRTDVKVKEELTTDTEGEGSLMGDSGSADLRATEVSPLHLDSQQQISPPLLEAPSNHVHIKEEPQERDLSVLSPFSLCRDRPSSSANSLDLPAVGVGVGVRSSPSGPTTASLFSPDISTKTATDLLMKLSGEYFSSNINNFTATTIFSGIGKYKSSTLVPKKTNIFRNIKLNLCSRGWNWWYMFFIFYSFA